MIKKLQLTLAILKPHIISNPFAVKDIRHLILDNKFQIVKCKRYQLTMKDAAKFYEEHQAKFFYNRLVTFMTSGPSEIYILAKQNAIDDWRKLMGPTKVFKTQFEAPNTIRGLFGYSDTRNATHGSDSEISAKREISIFFPEFDYNQWFQEEKKDFKNEFLKLSENKFVH